MAKPLVLVSVFFVFFIGAAPLLAQQYYIEGFSATGSECPSDCDKFDARLTIDGSRFDYVSWCDGKRFTASGTIASTPYNAGNCLVFVPQRIATRGCAKFSDDRRTIRFAQAGDYCATTTTWRACLGGFDWEDNCK
jgi:hypothetical protein